MSIQILDINLKAEILLEIAYIQNIKAPMNKNKKTWKLIDKNKSNVNIAGLNILKTTQMPLHMV